VKEDDTQDSAITSSPQHPSDKDEKNLIARFRRLPIAIAMLAILVVGLGCTESIKELAAQAFDVFDQRIFEDTHYWDEGGAPSLMVKWTVKITDVVINPQRGGGSEMTMVIARAVITNKNKSQGIRMRLLSLLLKDKSGLKLFEKGIDIDLYQIYDPGESREFTENFYVSTGLVGDIKELGASSSHYSIPESSE